MGWRNENKNASFTVRRGNDKELQQAITDLLDRGYEVVRTGEYFVENKSYELNQSSTSKRLNRTHYAGVDHHKRCYAIIRRKMPV